MSGTLVLVLRVLLALALYAFLCLALWLSWQELRQASGRATQTHTPLVNVHVRKGETLSFARSFSQPQFTVGRDPTCELCIDDEAISGRHAKFSYHHGQWWIEDLHSTNGTRLNEVKLTTATVLTSGDEISCGEAILSIQLDSRAGATQPVEDQHD